MTASPVLRLLTESAPAHGDPEAVDVWWQAWSFDLTVLIPVAIAALFYLDGLSRWRDRSRLHSRWRTTSYFSGLLILVLALESPLDYLSAHHFTFHMVQHEVLMMVALPLILLGAPTTPSLLGMPRWLRMGVVRRVVGQGLVRAIFRFVTHPLVAVIVLTVLMYAWHLAPGWYDAALRNEWIHALQHGSFILAALLFWWNVIDPMPLRARMSYPLRMVYLLVGSTPKHFLAALLAFGDEPLYDVYAEVERIIDMSLLTDQALGGMLMWAPSQMMHLAGIGIIFFIWANRSEEETRREEEAARALAAAEEA
ncbi:MAG TPA: cytochrome c oxidase assembly protein [Dehalococcoidia bacterium]|nr:cytochrome c oxidase assembly protein [Dehalococcoidia bacterium]